MCHPSIFQRIATNGYTGGSPGPRRRRRLVQKPPGSVFPSQPRFKWEGGVGEPNRGDGHPALVRGKAIVTVARLSSQLPSNANAILSHVVCTVGVLIFHDFLFRCQPALEPRRRLPALFGHQGDLVDIVSS